MLLNFGALEGYGQQFVNEDGQGRKSEIACHSTSNHLQHVVSHPFPQNSVGCIRLYRKLS